MLPSGHYSQVITSGIATQKNIDLIVYTDKNLKNREILGCGEIRTVWSKSPRYVVDIISHLVKDKPDLVHLQHELNMYGGMLSAALFPILVSIIKIMRIKVVVTFHGTVEKKKIDKKFLHLFHQDNSFLRPWMLILFFDYTFLIVSFFADWIIVHTTMAKKILISDYHIPPKKIKAIPISIPVENKPLKRNIKPYFFYFGYMVRRKGLGYIIDGFKRFTNNNPNSNYKLILAGGTIPGQEAALNEIIEEIKRSNLEKKIEIRGFIDQKQQDDLYNSAYAILIPAEITIGSSGPLFHSDSYGKCAIASKIGFFNEDIKHLSTGILTKNDKWDYWMEYTVKHPELVKKIEKEVTLKAQSRSPFMIASQYNKLYHER